MESTISDMISYINMCYQTKKTFTDLPPTSHSAKGHILRVFYAANIQLNCLTTSNLDPMNFGFYKDDDGLIKATDYQVLFPDDLLLFCNCGKCATKKCPCRNAGQPCCVYCRCTFVNNCKNPHAVLKLAVTL